MKNFGFFVVLFAVLISGTVANASLVAWYQMNDPIGTESVTDSSGHSYNAGMAWDTLESPRTSAYTGSSLNFAGDSMRIWTPTNMGATGDFTWSVKIKTTQTANGGIINHSDDRWNQNTGNQSVSLFNNGKILFFMEGDNWIMSEASVNDGVWHTVTLVNYWENVCIYIDGQKAALDYCFAEGNNWFPNLDTASDSYKYWLGASSFGSFVGEMKDVQIYDNALSDAEISALVPEPATISLLGLGLILFRRK
ncbi:MAG: LamG-like jellyroll fold domain-containing protein [Phycisphaerales bacterium]